MKRYLIPFLLLLEIQASTAQTDTATTAVDSTKKVIQISKEIKAVAGAKPQFKTESINAAANVEESAKLMKAEAPPTSVGVLDAAGKTSATLDVAATGGATFSIPFTLPPGLGNAVPQLGLAYNSHAGSGTAGYGWNISGLSAISRIPSTAFHDGQINGVNFNLNDRFALDGQRLILKSGTYGSDGAEYQTENYSNTKIISRGVSPYGASYGPQYFEVYLPDGTKAYYGLSQNSRTPTDYAVTYTENPLGARISYTYRPSGNTLNISQINYGTLGSIPGINQINFSYLAASRAEKVYVGGLSFYKSEILHKISLVANGINFRHYNLKFNAMPLLNYQRLASIQEFDGEETKAFDPINFTYGATGGVITSNTISNLSLSGIASNNSQLITSDFTGNGSMDFLLYPNTKNKFWAFYDLEPGSQYMQIGYEVNIGSFKEIFPATWLTHNNKILAGQGMIAVKDAPNGTFKFEMYSSGTVAPVYYQYDRMWSDVAKTTGYWSQFYEQMMDVGNNLRWQFISGDFNGDALTDVIAIHDGLAATGEEIVWYQDPSDDRLDHYYTTPIISDRGSSAYFVNLDRRLTSNHVTNLGELTESFFINDKLHTGDFDGDGKSDILHIGSNNKMSVYTMNSRNILELLWQTSDSRITNSQPVLMGDYNGDGKMDLMFSTGNNSLFATFMSTGKSFEKYENYQPFSNTAAAWDGRPGVVRLDLYNLISNDVDGDGKTDIIATHTITKNDNAYGTANIRVYHNIAAPGALPSFVAGSSGSQYTNLNHYPIPVFLNPNRPNYKLEFGFMSNNSVSLFKFSKDFRTESQVAGISQNGIYHEIEYKELMPDQYSGNVPLYQTSYDQSYPYVDLQGIPSQSVVSKLTRYFENEKISQVFSYGKAVTHAHGLGFLGFGESIRSNWHTDESDVNRMFNISINSPGLRGATLKTFTTRTPYLSTSVRTANALPIDTALSSVVSNAQTIITVNSITLLPGFEAKGSNGDFIAKINDPAQGINDGGKLSDYITRTDYTYNTQLLPNKVFANAIRSVITKDLLNNTSSLVLNKYDVYYNTMNTSTIYGGGVSKVLQNTYDNSLSENYYVGRPLITKSTLTNNNGSFTTEEEYSYTGYLPVQIRKKSNNAPVSTETIVYDSFGNIIKKTSTTEDGQRTVSKKYDPTGRFVISFTDEEGLTSTSIYNSGTGTLTSKTNPYNHTESYTYDSWNRQKSMIDYLGAGTYRSYLKNSNYIEIAETDDEGRSRSTIANALGQSIEVREKNILGQFTGKASRYDVYGKLIAESERNASGIYNQWNLTKYDEYGRVRQFNSYTGQVTNYSYNGLVSTVTDGSKSVTTTKNILGQIVAIQDLGGTINYNYFSSGNLKSAEYEGILQSIQEDNLGRRIKLIDPSAGTYQYEYDAFDQIKKEITPKGVTEYTYDGSGKLLQKIISGDKTNMRYVYTYDNTTKLLTKMFLTNADGNNTNYIYTYDFNHRLSIVSEDNLLAHFTKSYTYDNFGRIETESHEAINKLNNLTVKKTLELHYQNGEHLQTILQGNGQVIWKINALDSKGNLSSLLHGSNLKSNFQYDQYGFPQQRVVQQVSSSPVTLMSLGANFDPQRRVLNNRSNSALNWNEDFDYDNLERLVTFNDNKGNNSQTYDNRGRILNNSQLGTYSYSSGSYKSSELALNPSANTYYQTRLLQQITYNAFRGPVEIIEPGFDRVSFQYNGALGRAHMYYGGEQADKMLRRYRRHYSGDGRVEITNDIQNGTTTFVFYLDGDAYTASSIWKEVRAPGQDEQNIYYLHRDYLGSVMMITNNNGAVVEKRQFDAWGNIVSISDGNGNNLTSFKIIDRGYTGHEHLFGTGLIHMNARLYDPKLHRFLSPDNYIQNPYNTQNFNRYGYVLNNPLALSDPSGEFFFSLILPGIGTFIDAALWGAVIGGASYTASVAISDGGFNNWSWGQFGKSVGIGAISGVATAGIGNMFGAVGSNGFMGEFARAYMHGFSGGLISEFTGGSFMQGFASGGLSSIAGSGLMMYGGSFGNSQFGNFVFSGISGGIGAELTGDNFWRGLGTGVMTAGLNHFQNTIQNKIAKIAESYIDDTQWAYDASKSNFAEGTNKCNLFVYDITTEAGAGPGLPNKMKGFKSSPPTAGQWADPNYKISGWKVVSSPQRGDVASYSFKYADASGHVGIMNSKTTSVGANHNIVRQTDFGYSRSHLPAATVNYVYRRYIGK